MNIRNRAAESEPFHTYEAGYVNRDIQENTGGSFIILPAIMVAGDLGLPDQPPPIPSQPYYLVHEYAAFGPPLGDLTRGPFVGWLGPKAGLTPQASDRIPSS